MSDFIIQTVFIEQPVTNNVTVTISSKKATEPDSSFVVNTTTQVVRPNGMLDPAYTISGLDSETWYTVRVASTCGASNVAYITLMTGSI